MSSPHKHPEAARMTTRAGVTHAAQRNDITRPERVLQEVSRRYPGLWPCLESVRSDPVQSCGLQGWDAWCYLPVNVVAGAMGYMHRDRFSQDVADMLLCGETRLVSALAGWRMTKGVYTFDPTVLKAIMESEVSDGLPEEAFLRLPDWCVYIPTPGVDWCAGLPMHGFFAYVDDHGAGGTGHPPELNFEILIDPKSASGSMLRALIAATPALLVDQAFATREKGPGAMPEDWLPTDREFIHLHQNVDLAGDTFSAAIARLAEKTEVEAAAWQDVLRPAASSDLLAGAHMLSKEKLDAARATAGSPAVEREILRSLVDRCLRLANLVLYLCADEADIEPRGYGERRCAVRATEGTGKRVYPAAQLQSWEVGYRIGSSLRLAAAETHAADATRGGEGHSPRPHMRRAHWHTFLTGPRSGPQSRRVKWLPPIAVRAAVPDALVPTVHRVIDR